MFRRIRWHKIPNVVYNYKSRFQRPLGKAKIFLNFTTVNARKKANPISVFDSGLGGLTVLEAVQKQLPDLDIIYLGDHNYAPYGVCSSDDI